MKLYDKLLAYSNSDIYPMHMPGHKRNNNILQMVNPYSIDVTEIEGFDNLFHASGILKESMERASCLYGTTFSDYLVGGSSAGILSGIAACTNKGDKVIIARNCHKSVYNAIYLNELQPIYVYPHFNKEYSINCGISPENIETLLIKHQEIKLIVITSPSYEGVISDVKRISELAHQYKIPLLVDEAHGAHLGFHSYFPQSSIKEGADVIVHSLHKTLPSFTQTGLLHVNSPMIDYDKIKRCLSIYQSSSPSYLFMASIDNCIHFLLERKEEMFSEFQRRLQTFYKEMNLLKNLKIITRRKKEGKNGFFDFDPSKIVICVRDTNITGAKLYHLLLDRYKIQVEMASRDYVIAMTSICDTDMGFKRLGDALLELDQVISKRPHQVEEPNIEDPIHTYMAMTSYEASISKTELVSFEKSEGKITKEYIYLYPPGIPILIPGEIITLQHIRKLLEYKKHGLSIQGLDDHNMNKIKVVGR